MDEELRSLAGRLRGESGGSVAYERLLVTEDQEELAGVLIENERPLWAREIAAFRLGCAGDRRSFEALVLLLNHRDPARCVSAAHALARLNDPAHPGRRPRSPRMSFGSPTPCFRSGCSRGCARRSPYRR